MYVMQRLARSGVCSRRQAQLLIKEGRVSVDNKRIDDPAVKIESGQELRLDGRLVELPRPQLWMYNKPKGELVTRSDPRGRHTIFDTLARTPLLRPAARSIPHGLGSSQSSSGDFTPLSSSKRGSTGRSDSRRSDRDEDSKDQFVPAHVMPIGRLDYDSEGVQLLTNDGPLAQFLMDPRSEILRRYHVWIQGRLSPDALAELRSGTTIDGFAYQPVHVQTLAANALELVLFEGKNREIRRLMEHFGVGVRTLRRVQYGPYQLGSLPLAKAHEVPVHAELLESFQQSPHGQEA